MRSQYFAPAIAFLLLAYPAYSQDNAAIVVKGRAAESNANMRYHLMGHLNAQPKPEKGYALLLVLPGGDGSSEFVPFVRRIHENALTRDFLVAELVAKEWRCGQFQQLVWPIESNTIQEAEFATEAFAQAVIQDVQKDYSIDPERIYALAWSSGGPAAYSLMLKMGSPVKGAFIAMSVFKPRQLPPMENAQGKRFYIYHSPDDFIQMRFPEQAVQQLRQSGARTHLQRYSGGHGWRGNTFADIRRGIEWLEAPAAR